VKNKLSQSEEKKKPSAAEIKAKVTKAQPKSE
jgi:hypothetical protein